MKSCWGGTTAMPSRLDQDNNKGTWVSTAPGCPIHVTHTSFSQEYCEGSQYTVYKHKLGYTEMVSVPEPHSKETHCPLVQDGCS
ncbi:hypothetical protein ACRRTK_008936 [Alexandromys fortis]